LAGILQDLQTHLQPRIEHVRKVRENATEDRRKDGEPGSRP